MKSWEVKGVYAGITDSSYFVEAESAAEAIDEVRDSLSCFQGKFIITDVQEIEIQEIEGDV